MTDRLRNHGKRKLVGSKWFACPLRKLLRGGADMLIILPDLIAFAVAGSVVAGLAGHAHDTHVRRTSLGF